MSIDVRDGDAHDRLAGFFERVDGGVLLGIGRGAQAQIDEDAIISVNIGRADFLAVNGNQALAFLAGGFGEKLFEPRAEIGNAGRSEDRDFVAAGLLERSQNGAENRRRDFASAGTTEAQAWTISSVPIEELGDVDALNRAGNHAEIRKRGIAAADARRAEKNAGGSRRLQRPAASSSRDR